ncbi:tail assembly chaperone [Phytobacter diazotrophicus]|uniref:tail assembly chaperone n=1 Tax=Phytobacter diazotrophicus TaxID=395631 RepID=UPI0030762807
MESVYFSPSLLTFIPARWKDDGTYTTETWPADAVLVTDEVAQTFWKQTPPDGKQLGAVDGEPAWVDIPQPPNSELLKIALQNLTIQYQADIESLNRAWLAAAVADGTTESSKKSAVVSQIAARKTQYASDRAAVIAQYPV